MYIVQAGVWRLLLAELAGPDQRGPVHTGLWLLSPHRMPAGLLILALGCAGTQKQSAQLAPPKNCPIFQTCEVIVGMDLKQENGSSVLKLGSSKASREVRRFRLPDVDVGHVFCISQRQPIDLTHYKAQSWQILSSSSFRHEEAVTGLKLVPDVKLSLKIRRMSWMDRKLVVMPIIGNVCIECLTKRKRNGQLVHSHQLPVPIDVLRAGVLPYEALVGPHRVDPAHHDGGCGEAADAHWRGATTSHRQVIRGAVEHIQEMLNYVPFSPSCLRWILVCDDPDAAGGDAGPDIPDVQV